MPIVAILGGLLIGTTVSYSLTRSPLIVRLITIAVAVALLYLTYNGMDSPNRTNWSLGLAGAIAGLLVTTLLAGRRNA